MSASDSSNSGREAGADGQISKSHSQPPITCKEGVVGTRAVSTGVGQVSPGVEQYWARSSSHKGAELKMGPGALPPNGRGWICKER